MLQPGKKLGPFFIEKELGSGAMGTVYSAQFGEKKKRVAIKVIASPIGKNKTLQARFEREAEILKQLKHPHIVRLLATGKYQQSPFYAMEYIEGRTLEQVLEERGRLAWEEVVSIGKQLCEALQHVHDAGIIHRDLKPSNIMVLADGTIKLTDFGIAKDLDVDGLTATNHTVGTAAYMSPEQCRGSKEITGKSDLYSLGVVLYELLTGRKPFMAESVMEMFTKHTSEPFPRASRFVLDIPVWLDNLVCQLLEKRPEDRPLNAKTVADSLLEIKNKVEVKQSAGVERALMRKVDRTKDMARLNETEKDAARALVGKKKRKKKKIPFYQKGWFVVVSVAGVLLCVGVFVYFVFLRPPSLQSLYDETAKLMKEGDFDSLLEARRGPLASFFTYYAGNDGELAKQMRLWSDEADCKVYDHWLHNRLGRIAPDEKGEATARQALHQEDEGKLPEALKTWQKLAQQKGSEDKEEHGWGLVGEKYAGELLKLDALMKSLQKKVKEKAFEGESAQEKLAVQALRASEDSAAKGLWEKLKDETRNKADQRQWYLFAAYKLRKLEG